MGLGANPQRGFPGNAYPGVLQLRVGALARGSPLLWGGKYSRESKPVANLLVFVSFTSKFASNLTNITSTFADNRRIDRM